MRFLFFLLFALFTTAIKAQVPPPTIPAPDTTAQFYPTYQAATQGKERSSVAYRFPNGNRYPVYVSEVGYSLYCLAYDSDKGYYLLSIPTDAAAGAN
jgi:hypothetical protein